MNKKLIVFIALIVLIGVIVTVVVITTGNEDYEDEINTEVEDNEDKEEAKVLVEDTEANVDDEADSEDLADYTFMVFMNGTDLESQYDEEYGELAGAGSIDIEEMTSVGSSDKVNFLLETGGTLEWANEDIDASQNQRWLIEKDGIIKLEDLGKQSMGESTTLEEYILWAVENYPAKKYVLDLWNHGGGPIVGYGVDEYFEGDALVLEELTVALENVKASTGIQFEVIGFDACLMGSVEVAMTVAPYANYLVASEELEPGHGWNYAPIYEALVKDSTIDGARLGQIIADGFYEQAEVSETVDEVTLAVTDLSSIQLVSDAIDELMAVIGDDINDEDSLRNLYKVIANAKSFGGNTEEQGYTDMTDIGDFASRLSSKYEVESQNVIDALDTAIVYKIGGKLHQSAYGLSIYLPYRDKEYFEENLEVLDTLAVSENHKSFVNNYVTKLSGVESIEGDNTGITVYLPADENSSFELIMSQELLDQTQEVFLNIYEIDEENNLYRSLGFDALVIYDEETNSFIEDFGGYWGTLDGVRVAQQIVYIDDEYIEYEIPVVLNGERVNLQAFWYFAPSTEAGGYYELYGGRKAINSTTNMPDKQVIVLKDGDRIQPIFKVIDMDTDEEFEEYGEEIVYSNDSVLSFDILEEDNFMFRFKILDFSGEVYYSEFNAIIFDN